MSTANKLTYLNGTKKKLKDTINYAGAGIASDTFRSYPETLYNTYADILNGGTEDLFNGIPHVTGSGTDLNLNHSAECKMKIDLKGNTSQVSTTGKNKFNVSDKAQTTHQYGITYKVENNVFTINGTNTGTNSYPLVGFGSDQSIRDYYNNLFQKGKTFTLSANNNLGGLYFQINYFKEGSSSQSQLVNLYSMGGKATFTIPQDYDRMGNIFLGVYGNATTGNGSFSMQLEEGSDKTSFEPFTNGASPNPSYPQDIQVVSGDNEIKVEGKNLFDKSSIEQTSYYIEPTTGNHTTQTGSIIYKFEVMSNTSYVRNNVKNSSNVTFFSSITYWDKNDNYISGSWNGNQVITTPNNENVKYMILSTSNNMTTYSDTQTYLDNFMIEKGTQATPYEPYVSQTYPIYLGVENLFDVSTITENMTINETTGQVNIGTNDRNTSDYIEVEPNTKYTCNNTMTRYAFYDSNKSFLQYGTISTTITTSSTTKYIRFSYDNSLSNIQLEKGSKANHYTEYGITPIELCKIGDYQDRIYKDSGKWYLHKEIGKVVLNGSETGWNTGTSSGIYRYYKNFSNVKVNFTNLYCVSNYFSYNNTEGASQLGYFNVGGLTTSKNGNFVFNPFNDTENKLNDFKTWLGTHNTSVYYPLETPTYTEITDSTLIEQLNALENARSYLGQTNISQTNNDKPFIVDAIAALDYDYIS